MFSGKKRHRDSAFRATPRKQKAVSPCWYVCTRWLATAKKEGKQIRARMKEGERGGTHAREKRSREKGGRQRVRPGFACQTIREIALVSLLARSTPSRGQSSQLTLSSAQRGQQEERGSFHVCERRACVY